jgi:transposase
LTTKVHLACENECQALGLVLSAGEVHDTQRFGQIYHQAQEAKHFERVVADKGYDSDALRLQIANNHQEAIIPSRCNRRQPAAFRPRLYRLRNQPERLINKMKNFRRVATRYDKLACMFLATVQLVASLLTLQQFVNAA